jgi:hypothetical protein
MFVIGKNSALKEQNIFCDYKYNDIALDENYISVMQQSASLSLLAGGAAATAGFILGQ